ncbi:MAG: hypothetical protein OEW15_09780 [Nitrospirota bacterium]|nr:hypothetical protein [Nitrospirota bacterium]
MLIIVNDTPRAGSYLLAVVRLSSKPLLIMAATVLVVPALLFLLLASMVQTDMLFLGSRKLWLWLAGLTPFLLASVIAATVSGSVWGQWRKSPQLNEPRTLVFSDEGMVVIGKTYAVRSSWSDIAGGEVWAGQLLFRTVQGAVHVLSLRSIGSGEQTRKLFELLRSVLGVRFR